MNLTIEQLLRGKATKIKNKEFLPTEGYVTPFFERMDKIPGTTFRCHAELPKQITITTAEELNSIEDITYNRVWIEAILPESYIEDNHSRVAGMVYGIDTRVPVVKFYLASINCACCNMMVFNPAQLKVSLLEAGKKIDFTLLDSILQMTQNIHNEINILKNINFINDIQHQKNILGEWDYNCLKEDYSNGISKVSISHTTAIKAFKSIFSNSKSKYYIGDKNTDYFNIYNAWTDIISNSDSDIMNKFEKTYLLSKILNIHECKN